MNIIATSDPAPGTSGARTPRSASVAAVAAGAAILLARVMVVNTPARAPLLLGMGYLAVVGVSLSASTEPAEARRLHPIAAWAAGMLALLVGALAVGQAAPLGITGYGVLLGAMAAIAEEAFFRRLLYGRLARWGAAVAVGGSALAFALVHVPLYGWAGFWLDLGAGGLLSWQRWTSGSWAAPAATHVAANILAVLP